MGSPFLIIERVAPERKKGKQQLEAG